MGRATGRSAWPWHRLSGVAVPLRQALVGGAAAGALGGLAGLVVGLLTYPPTAWFAILEIGLPAAVLGFGIGLVVGSLPRAIRSRRARRRALLR